MPDNSAELRVIAREARELGLFVETAGYSEDGFRGYNASGTGFGAWSIYHYLAVTIWTESPEEARTALEFLGRTHGRVTGYLAAHASENGTMDCVYYR